MEVIRAIIKKDILAVIAEPMYLDTELFIGKYIDIIMPINKANKV